jgi:hypothetical protein
VVLVNRSTVLIQWNALPSDVAVSCKWSGTVVTDRTNSNIWLERKEVGVDVGCCGFAVGMIVVDAIGAGNGGDATGAVVSDGVVTATIMVVGATVVREDEAMGDIVRSASAVRLISPGAAVSSGEPSPVITSVVLEISVVSTDDDDGGGASVVPGTLLLPF